MDTVQWFAITFFVTTILIMVLALIAQSKNNRHAEITFMDGSKRSTKIVSKQFGSIQTEFGSFRTDEKGILRSDFHSGITLTIL